MGWGVGEECDTRKNMKFPDRVYSRKCPGNFLQRFPEHFLEILGTGHVGGQVHFLLPQEIPCILYIPCTFQETEIYKFVLYINLHVHCTYIMILYA